MTTIGSPSGNVLYDPNSTNPTLSNVNVLMSEFPDNSQRRITAQDLRDLVATFFWHVQQGVISGLPANPHNVTATEVGAIATIQGISGDVHGNITFSGSNGITISTTSNGINIALSQTSVGGIDQQVQYNACGCLTGSNCLTYNYNCDVLNICGSLANGTTVVANGCYSHAEGCANIASGCGSHAEGDTSISYGPLSHAEGYCTSSFGKHSHTEGHTTCTGCSIGTAACLQSINSNCYCFTFNSTTPYNLLNGQLLCGSIKTVCGTATIIGVGDNSHCSFICTCGLPPGITTSAYSGVSFYIGGGESHVEGCNNVAIGYASHAEGNTNLTWATFSHAEGLTNNSCSPYSHAEGNNNTTYGKASHAEGYGNTACGISSHTEGCCNTSLWDYSHTEGYSNITCGFASHAEGSSTGTGYYAGIPVAISGSSPVWCYTFHDNSCLFYLASLNPGANLRIPSSCALIIGVSLAGGNCSIACTCSYLNASGVGVYFGGDYSHGEGQCASAIGVASHAEGGGITQALASHAEGMSAACGQFSHAEGCSCTFGNYSHAEGIESQACGNFSHAEGYGSISSGNYSHSEGSSFANNDLSHAEGIFTNSNGFGSHTEGVSTCSVGCASHAEGSATQSTGCASHAEGSATTAYADTSHAEGCGSNAFGFASHAEGINTGAYGCASHAEGILTNAVCDFSHTEGGNTNACGCFSHAEGNFTNACSFAAHSEGDHTVAYGFTSHSEGYYTNACSNASHAEGYCTTAFGISSHSEGCCTTAQGSYSHAYGYGSIACYPGEQAYANGIFSTNGDNQIRYTMFQGSMAANAAAICLGPLCLTTCNTYFIKARYLASDPAADSQAMYEQSYLVTNNAGTASLKSTWGGYACCTGSHYPAANPGAVTTSNCILFCVCGNSSCSYRYTAVIEAIEMYTT